ncbi:MAG TPA: PaaI family thioesterase [Candidatus Thermoplasmatota archaeon]|nr:PaaI family thioesterase [Candidatus Thermoplasmatota archaeon]
MSHPPPGAGPFSKLLGVTEVRAHGDGLEVALEVDERHHNEGGIVHGGVQMALLDMAMGGAVVRTLLHGEWTATSSMTTDFMRPAIKGRLVARGRVERRGKLTAFPVGELRDASGEVVARATGVWAIRTG